MIKSIFWLLMIIVLTSLTGVAIGFYQVYEWLGLYWMLSFLAVYISIIIASIILIIVLLGKIKVDVERMVKEIKDFVGKLKQMSTKDIIKIVLKLLKNKGL